jgi:hypothetical protein
MGDLLRQPEYLDARDVARVLRVTVRDLVDGAQTPGGLPLLEVRPRRYMVEASELAAWERRRTLGRLREGSRLVDAVRSQAAGRRSDPALPRWTPPPPPPAPSPEEASRAATLLP